MKISFFDTILLSIFVISSVICLYCVVKVEESRLPIENSMPAQVVIYEYSQPEPQIIVEKNTIPDVPYIRRSTYVNLTFEEMDMLQQIAMCEARGEDAKGQALVMRVVINRSRKTGKSIYDTIYARGQFATSGMGSYIPNEANNEAICLITDGWDESKGALFFSADGYNGKEPLFKHGNHYFSK